MVCVDGRTHLLPVLAYNHGTQVHKTPNLAAHNNAVGGNVSKQFHELPHL